MDGNSGADKHVGDSACTAIEEISKAPPLRTSNTRLDAGANKAGVIEVDLLVLFVQ